MKSWKKVVGNRVSRVSVVVALLGVGVSGCGEEEPSAPEPAAQSTEEHATPEQAADNNAPTPPAAVPAPSADEESGPLDQTPLAESIQVEFLERQLFHPASRSRTMRDIEDLDKSRRVSGSGDFSLGLVFAATNNSPYLLASPRVLSDVVVQGEHGRVTCSPSTNRYHEQQVRVLSRQVSERSPWGSERSSEEAVWRPQETIRVGVELDCGPAHLQDIGLEGLAGQVKLAAQAVFVPSEMPCFRRAGRVCDNDVIGVSEEIALPARAFTLQSVTLPTGESGYAAGDLFVHASNGEVFHDTLSSFGASAFSLNGQDVPASPSMTTETLDEWSLSLSNVSVRHWMDITGTPKGERVVSVSASINIDSAAIEGRLRADLDAARTAQQTAQTAVQNAQTASDQAAAAAEADENQQAAADAASDTLRDAESALRTADRALSTAQRNYDRAMGSERSRLGRLLSCDRVELVTQGRNLRAINGRDMSTACRALSDGDSVQVTWIYLAERYEIPLGITYSLGRDPRTNFFAASSFANFDPR